MSTQRNSVQIRQFVLDEFDTLHSFWGSIETGLGMGVSDSREEIAKKYARDPDLFLVAEDAGRIVGSVIGGFDGRRGMIYHLAVDRAYRHQGLGTRLMTEVEARLRAKGCRRSYLLVRKGNHTAQSLYEHLGWSDMTDRVIIMGKELK